MTSLHSNATKAGRKPSVPLPAEAKRTPGARARIRPQMCKIPTDATKAMQPWELLEPGSGQKVLEL